MKINILFKSWAVLLILTAIISACAANEMSNGDEEEYETVICPTKSIIGKWKLVELRYTGLNRQPNVLDGAEFIFNEERGNYDLVFKREPAGYVEYFADGRFRWFDYTTKEYLFESTFRLEQSFRVYNPDGYEWQLYYEMTKVELDDGRVFYECPEFPDKPLTCRFAIRFIDQNTKSLWTTGHFIIAPPYFIYKRIKQ